ncbi:DUF4112 domain-containing protein [Nordella sp. HKS 07]|uniref:DUF4112 domain-containing protein n=1 Tax=Nordella sp. HKS 07 TaxID=2712222 RepID=UPI0013E1ADA7|nr:DUF4112 domain-containing protein [Nordella sp. HKS 07]QIG51974.1 DUF4112 domain-containing protein [Nordella sp. HKS 07]
MTTFAATAADFGLDDHARRLARLRSLARVMDTALRIPGTRIRFGADSVLGFIPGAGDVLALGISAYALMEAVRFGAPPRVVARMIGNVAIDTGLGAIPVAGDIFDLFFKSNTRNLKLLLEHLERERRV